MLVVSPPRTTSRPANAAAAGPFGMADSRSGGATSNRPPLSVAGSTPTSCAADGLRRRHHAAVAASRSARPAHPAAVMPATAVTESWLLPAVLPSCVASRTGGGGSKIGEGALGGDDRGFSGSGDTIGAGGGAVRGGGACGGGSRGGGLRGGGSRGGGSLGGGDPVEYYVYRLFVVPALLQSNQATPH
jgi:hypothetical protein